MKTTKIQFIFIILFQFIGFVEMKAQQEVKFEHKAKDQKINIFVGGKLFSAYMYSAKIDKPVLYPLQTASGTVLSRGFPLNPRPNERTDHPHHIGIWFNYGDVNGLDFWNNSYAIPDSIKSKYGSIRHRQILTQEGGKQKGTLVVTADWVDMKGTVLLKEQTEFVFSGDASQRVIERTTVLTAQQQAVSMKDNKEGMLGIRVARELEMPADKPEIFTDAQGIPTKVAAMNNKGVTGNFLTSGGKAGNDAWGTRGNWCLMYGKKNNEPVSIAILDHPGNPGYPTYWHARGYGLFAANNLGQEALSGGKEKLDFSLAAGKSTTFRYKIVISNKVIPTQEVLNKMSLAFGGK
ncbi:MAG: PmoA family protein [Chitinophagaceae bacterium]